MGFFNCCCSGGGDCSTPVSACFHVTGCASANVQGATITFDDGAGHVYSATTDSVGSACVSILRPGTYTRTVSKAGYNSSTATVTIACGSTPSTQTVALTAATGWTCAGNCCGENSPFPNPPPTLHLTTAGGSFLIGAAPFSGCVGPAASSQVIRCSGTAIQVVSGFTGLYATGWSCPGTTGKISLSFSFGIKGPIAGFTPKYLWVEYLGNLGGNVCTQVSLASCCGGCSGFGYDVTCDFFGTCHDGVISMTGTMPASFSLPGGNSILNPLGTTLTLTN